MVTAAAHTTERRMASLVRRCHAGLDAPALREEIAEGVARLLDVDAVFVASVDPLTMLMTGVFADEPLRADSARFLGNELGADDVNTFTGLARARDPVSTLDAATGGRRVASSRYTDILAPLGLGDELRAALRSGPYCWGVLCLHREDRPDGFGDRELRLLRRLAPHLGEGLRLAVARNLHGQDPERAAAPGMLLVNEDSEIVSATPAAQVWLAELGTDDWSATSELPVPVTAAVASLRARGGASAARVQVRSASGQWVTVHADWLDGAPTPQIAVMLEPVAAGEMRSLFLRAHNLTPAQERVAALVLQGRSTREISDALHISAYTVQEHLTAVFDKVGVRTRRELAASLMGLSA